MTTTKPMMQTINIAPEAALAEAVALNEFYANRAKLQAHELHLARQAIVLQAAEIKRLTPAAPPAVPAPPEDPATASGKPN